MMRLPLALKEVLAIYVPCDVNSPLLKARVGPPSP